MKLFVWNDADAVSANYHSNGGLVVIAESFERAREMIAEATKKKPYSQPDAICEALTIAPDLIRECEGPEYIAVHPNAGCC